MLPRLLVALLLTPMFLPAQSGGSQPVRYQAEYTRIYSDDLEAVSPSASTGFVLGTAGSFTSTAAETISGNRSIKGAHSGQGSWTSYLQTDPAVLPLSPNHSYRITFRYRILIAPNQEFNVRFYSLSAGSAGIWGPSQRTAGAAGDVGTVTLSGTLAPYDDYCVQWSIVGTGAIAVDDIQIADMATSTVIAAEDGETMTPAVGPGLLLQWGATVETNASLVIGGKASIRLSRIGMAATDPAVVNLQGNTTYVVEFQYRILDRGNGDAVLYFRMLPAGTTDGKLGVGVPALLKNAPVAGTFSTGAQTADAASYILSIHANGSTVIIDNLSIFRKDAVQTEALPPAWSNLMTLPYPRLGKYQQNKTLWLSQFAPGEGVPFSYSVDQIESRLAFHDVVFGLDLTNQPGDPASLRRIRQLNPNIVLLPYRDAEEQPMWLSAPPDKTINIEYQFFQATADSWYARNSHGKYIDQPGWSARLMNISDYCPVVNGQTYFTSLLAWLNRDVLPSGEWDGVFFDILLGSIQSFMAYGKDALPDFDWNRNGVRDETKALSNEMIRSGVKRMLADLRSRVGDRQLVMGNAGPRPELSLAPYVNGYVFECFNWNWNVNFMTNPSPAGWRNLWGLYRTMQATTRPPHTNVLEGCGFIMGEEPLLNGSRLAPTAKDLQNHRIGLATALLSDGFYSYDFSGAQSAPYWFDEYSVNENGTAVEDRGKKGYLGRALADAVELAAPGTLVFQEDFESGAVPASLSFDAANVFVTQAREKVIAGKSSLVISNPDHTRGGYFSATFNSAKLPLAPAKTYLVTFDWRILSTVDVAFSAGASASGQVIDNLSTPGVVSGDSGTSQFPFTTPASGPWTLGFTLNGGGEVAIDNVRIYDGGVGPWRRDFENGFVLVNPLLQPRTFSAGELAGTLKRTGIRRIKGTQAPDVNNGQSVTGGLTLAPFDGIILLADHIDARVTPSASKPSIKPNGVISAANFGGFSSIAPGSWIEIYGSNLSTTTRGWSAADFTGATAPTSLDGVKVTIGGRVAFVNYVSPSQINALVGSDVPAGPAQVIVSGPAGTSDPYIVAVEAVRPGLLAPPSFQVNGRQYVAALATSGAVAGLPSRPVRPGETIMLYGIGFGAVTPNLNAGTLVGQANSLSSAIEIRFGSTPAALAYYGLAPGATGLYQFNVMVPDVPDSVAVPLTFSLAGTIPSQTLYIAVQR